jgi:DNA-binding transcriptional LysR family regulator
VEQKTLSFDFRHLETFCRVADFKNFSKAAEALLLTQPTISGHILSLEHSLGLRLFDRLGREARLTKAGGILYDYATKILALRKETMNALSAFSQGIRGELSLGASTIPGEYLLPRLLGDFKKEFPNLTISLRMADSRIIIDDVLQGKIEFGMTGAKLKHPSLHYDLFEEDEIIVIGSSSPLHLFKRRLSFEEIFKEPWIMREDGSGTKMAVEKALNKRGRSLKEFREAIEMGSTSSLKQAVKAGLGYAFVSKKAVEEELTQGLLLQVDVAGMEPISRQIYLVSHRGKTLSPSGLRFLQYLKRRKGNH